MIPLTKFLHPDDYKELEPELQLVDRFPIENQASEHRRWEYAMALRAVGTWDAARKRGPLHPMALDVGGFDSPLVGMLTACGYSAHVVDPKVNQAIEEIAAAGVSAPIVTCVSVIEHVEDEGAFLQALVKVTEPGGMLFLTADAQEEKGPDDKHFRWMRKRIYDSESWGNLIAKLLLGSSSRDCFGFGPGDVDLTWHGSHVYDYNFVSLALWRLPQ